MAETLQLQIKQQKPSVNLNSMTVNSVELPELLIMLNGIVVKCLLVTLVERCFLSYAICSEYFSYKKLRYSSLVVQFVLIKEWLIYTSRCVR